MQLNLSPNQPSVQTPHQGGKGKGTTLCVAEASLRTVVRSPAPNDENQQKREKNILFMSNN